MLVAQHERLATVAGKNLGQHVAGQRFVEEKRHIPGVAVRRGALRAAGGIKRVRHDVPTHQFGHFVLLPARHRAQQVAQGGWLPAQHHVRQIRRAAALHIGEGQMHAMAAWFPGAAVQPIKQRTHRIRAVLRMQQQVENTRVTRLVVVVQILAAFEPVAGRQTSQNVACVGNLALCVAFFAIHQPHQRLHLVDAGPAGRAVHHQAYRALRREHAAQRQEARIGVGQVVQHTTAIDVVELAQAQ